MKEIVDHYYNLLKPESFDSCSNKVNDTVKSCEECFHVQYEYSEHSPSYDCEEKKKLYAVRFLFVHQAEVIYGLSQINSTTLDAWFNQGKCRVLSIGGGPGTDIFASLKYLAKHVWDKYEKIEFKATRMELEGSWDSYFRDLHAKTVEDLKLRYKGLTIPEETPETIYLDVNNGRVGESSDEFDIVCVSYLASELSDVTGLVEILDSALVKGSVLLITDIDNEDAKRRVEEVFDLLGMEVLEYSAPLKFGSDSPAWAGHIYGEYVPKNESEKYTFQYSSRVKSNLKIEPKAYLKAVNFLGYKK